MQKLVIIALALFTFNGMAQENRKPHKGFKHLMELRKDMTPDEVADLKTKKLVLELDLTDQQQEDVHKIVLAQAIENEKLREESKGNDIDKKGKLSKEEFLKIQNHRLDQKIAFKREMKTILSDEQYAKFEQMKPREHRKKRRCF